MILNRRPPPYIEAHRILELQAAATVALDAQQQDEVALRPFTICDHFARGGYEASLYAPNGEASADWLDRHLRDDMPLLPPEFEPRVFWSVLAKRNGDPATSIQRALKCKMAIWQLAFNAARREDVLFELPFWPEEAQGRAALIYFADTGLWHRAFAPFRDPTAVRNVLYDAKAWEGFNVNALRRLTLNHADCFVWRRDGLQAGEIDLVIAWHAGARWAVEISRDANKRASRAYHRGVEMIGADRKLIVRPGAFQRNCVHGCEYVDIEYVLRAVAEVCLADAGRKPGSLAPAVVQAIGL